MTDAERIERLESLIVEFRAAESLIVEFRAASYAVGANEPGAVHRLRAAQFALFNEGRDIVNGDPKRLGGERVPNASYIADNPWNEKAGSGGLP